MGIFDYVRNLFAPEKRSVGGYIDPSTFASGMGSGVPVNTDTALNFTAVFAAVRILSESVSQLPIKLCETLENGDKIVRNNHPLYNLIHNKPNQYMTTNVFISKCMVDITTTGNSYTHIVRNGAGRPVELLPLDVGDIEMKELDGQYYYVNKGTGDTYDTYDLLHFKGLSQDGLVGLSPIDTCANAISWGLGLEAYGNAYFRNGAKVSGVLETERAMSTESIERLRNSFDRNYSSVGNSQKTLVLEEGLKFKNISLSNEASQFLNSRKFSVEEIARIFSVPPHLLRDLSKSSFNNIQEQSREFVQYSLLPYIISFESEFNSKLFKKSEIGKLYFEFNTNALLRGNPKERSEYYRTMLNIGALSINEIRQKENMNSIGEEGDNLFMQLNMATLETIVSGKELDSKVDEEPIEAPIENIDIDVDIDEDEKTDIDEDVDVDNENKTKE